MGPCSAPESRSSPGRRGRPWVRVAAAERGCFLADYVGHGGGWPRPHRGLTITNDGNLDNRTDIAAVRAEAAGQAAVETAAGPPNIALVGAVDSVGGALFGDTVFGASAVALDDGSGNALPAVQLDLDDATPLPAEFIDLFLAKGWIVEGDMHRDPGFPGNPGFPNSAEQHDIAVIDFADRDTTPADLWTFTPATLPTAGQLDAIGACALDGYDWWVVGYGSQEAVRAPGGHTHPGGLVRRKAQMDFTALRNTWVRLAMNASRDLGGVCYGDSDGPNYVDIDGKLILAAVTSWGDIPCYATAMQYRTDTPSARAFLADFVNLP